MSSKNNEAHPEIIEIINICKISPDDSVCQKIKEEVQNLIYEESEKSDNAPEEEQENPDEDWNSTPKI